MGVKEDKGRAYVCSNLCSNFPRKAASVVLAVKVIFKTAIFDVLIDK